MSTLTDERFRLVATAQEMQRRLDARVNPNDELYDRADRAWDELAEWKRDHDECLVLMCETISKDHAYCEVHR